MPLGPTNTRFFHRALYGAILERITLYKRNDDQQQGTVRTLILYGCRRSMIIKTGEQIQGGMTADHHCVWHIPKSEMDRVGIAYFNSADRILDKFGRWWEPEATTQQTIKLMGNHICLVCLRIDPPGSSIA